MYGEEVGEVTNEGEERGRRGEKEMREGGGNGNRKKERRESKERERGREREKGGERRGRERATRTA